MSVRFVFDYVDMRFSVFAIEYLRKNEKVSKTVLPVYMGPRSNLLIKNGQKSRDTVPLTNPAGGRRFQSLISNLNCFF